jgi:hypothetical protein
MNTTAILFLIFIIIIELVTMRFTTSKNEVILHAIGIMVSLILLIIMTKDYLW